MSSNMTTFRIVSLPSGYSTESDVVQLVERDLSIGKVASLVVQKRNFNNVPYYTAFVDMEMWFDNHPANNLLFELEQAGSDTVVASFDGKQFSWPNGKPMNYLSFKASKKLASDSANTQKVFPSENVERPLSDTDWKSLYIPCIPDNLVVFDGTETVPFRNDDIYFMIEKVLNLGEVDRIDFVNQPKIGSTEMVKSAYIHFKKWYDNRNVEELRNQLNTIGSKKFYSFRGQPGNFTLKGSTAETDGSVIDRFLVFKINHKPIPAAPEGANVHQLSAANTFLESLVKSKDDEIAELKMKLAIFKSSSEDVDIRELLATAM
jgi:hypothetical protein